ncbi:MAG: SurA N-terminal domain-containing protein [Thermodesulfobacteriota bacterium]
MLESMRKSAGSWMIKVLLMLIVVAFIFMGAGSYLANKSNEVATVNGESISVNQYQRTYQNITANLRQQFGGQLDQKMLEKFNVEKQALNSVIENTLMIQVAQKNDIRVPKQALAETITQIPSFQENGSFDPQRYKKVLSQNRLSPQQFEAMQKEAMLTRRLKAFVGNTIAVSDAEAHTWYNWQNTSVNIAYTAFKPADVKDIEITDKDLADHYEQHKADYKTAPKRKARYVRFSAADHMEEVEVTEEEIKTYYNDHQSEYKKPETVSARHILLKVPENASDETVAEKRQQAEKILRRAKSGTEFAELARKHSEGPSKKDGGKLGTFEKGDMVEPFSEKAFAMEPGEISDPVRTQFGWHIIKVEEHQAETTQPLDEVKSKIRDKLARQKARNLAYDEAISIYDISFQGQDLVENAEEFGLELKTTDFFTQKQGPDGVDDGQGFAEKAFNLPLMEVSDITEINKTYYLIQPIEKQASQIPELEDIKDEVRADAAAQKRRRAAKVRAEDFLATAQKSGSIDKAAEDADKTVETTGFFTRNEKIPGIGQAPDIASAAFSLSAENPLPESVIAAGDTFYVLALTDKKVPEKTEFESNKDQTVSELTQRKRQQTFDKWIANLRANSEIEISDRFSN